MSIIAWIILGAIAGYLAGFFVSGDEGLGVIGHIVLGIVGALVGGFLASVLFNTKPIDGAFDISSIVAATIGAIIVVLVAGLVTRGTRTRLGLTRHRTGGPMGRRSSLIQRTPTGNGGRSVLFVRRRVIQSRPYRRPPPATGMQRDGRPNRSPRDTRSRTLLRVGPRATGGPGADDPVAEGNNEHRNTRNAAAMPMLSWLSGLHQRRLYRGAARATSNRPPGPSVTGRTQGPLRTTRSPPRVVRRLFRRPDRTSSNQRRAP